MRDGIGSDRVFKKFIHHMNLTSPSRRISLRELLAQETPSYPGRDGREYHLAMRELHLLKDIIDRLGIYDIKLPIMLYGESSFEQSTWRVEGDNECRVIAEIIEKSPSSNGKLLLYSPHLLVLRRKIPTATVCIYIP